MAHANGTPTLVPPPPGYLVDFENPQRQLQTQVCVVFAVENLLALLFLFQRLYTKVILMNLFQIEDCIVVAAWVFSSATQATLLAGWIYGVIGVHAWEISLDDYGLYSRLIMAAPLVYAPCSACGKAALCLFYGRLNPDRIFQSAVWATMFVIIGSYTGIFFSLIFACRPIAASWYIRLQSIAVCVNRGAIYIATAVIGVVTDVLLTALPVRTMWGLQMSRKQKVGLTAMFGVGSLIVESNLLVICCCLPILRRFFRHVAPRVIGEYPSGPSRKTDSSRKTHTWIGMRNRPKRQFDTLMNTIDSHTNLQGIRVELRGGNTDPNHKRDNDSEEAILYERTVQVTYESTQTRDNQDKTYVGRA